MEDVFKALGDITNPNQKENAQVNPSTDKRPLYVRLNEERTQGNWDCHYNNEIHPIGDEDGLIVIADFTNEDISIYVPTPTQAANAQYTTLAVNNLSLVAEALNNFVITAASTICSFKEGTIGYSELSSAIKQAKEALKAIS